MKHVHYYRYTHFRELKSIERVSTNTRNVTN